MKRRHLVLTSFILVMLIVISIWIVKIIRGQVPLIDSWTRALVDTFPDTYIYSFFRVITNLGSESFMYPFVAVVTILLVIGFRDWLPGVVFGLGVFLTHKANNLIKDLVARERPSILEEANAVGESFPSGHAMVPIVCYGLISYFLAKKIKSTRIVLVLQVFFALLVCLIGISRYVINVHYLTDIIAGFVFGFMCLLALIFVYEWVHKLRSRS
ncbi:phosphatase PAP2 family protein [Ornithinibacillus halotolerans]|uniref:Phosphatase PAP2 family protein n=1 Tax=Ornithinibacillus halotolerans TaxID=1274357 RepID=A0A916W7A4_9BACI|nr:phosphatase PAP2 family protein [Ornithinibacillus halotolerans]GGA73568.1 phosphatase PAP2 family protein [Ornithinibacillus halotolerans]